MTLRDSASRTSFMLAFALILSTGCAVNHQVSVLTAHPEPGEIPQRVAALETRVETSGDPAVRAKAYRELASLYLSPRNPSPDYGRALKALESCTAIDPAGCSSDEIETWIGVLRELQKRQESLAQADPEPRSFSERIKALEDAVQKGTEPSTRAQAYREMASLYLSHLNPSPDYGRALKALESCAAIDPAGCSSNEIKTWMSVLRELSKVSRDYRDLKNTIDKLQNIEIKIEEKRKQVQ